MDWLKTSFAAPDFPVLSPQGIPDDYTGRTLTKMFRKVTSITIPDDTTHYLIIPPIPGSSHILYTGPENSSADFVVQNYSDRNSLFGDTPRTTADSVTAFRYMSQLAELVPTTNATSWSGSISCYKVPAKMTETKYSVDTTPSVYTSVNTITGFQGVFSTSSDQYTAPSNLGVFAAATSDNSSFPFTNVIEGYERFNVTAVNTELIPGAFGTFRQLTNDGFPGWGELDTIVIAISGAANNSFILKTWAAIEFQVVSTSVLYQYSTMSPTKDEAALRCYKAFVASCPIAVSYYENANFWQTLLGIATSVSGALSAIPGPWGMVAGGVHGVLNNIGKKKRSGRMSLQVMPRNNNNQIAALTSAVKKLQVAPRRRR